jgi:hypothetical protein
MRPSCGAGFNAHRQGQPGQLGVGRPAVAVEGQRHQARARVHQRRPNCRPSGSRNRWRRSWGWTGRRWPPPARGSARAAVGVHFIARRAVWRMALSPPQGCQRCTPPASHSRSSIWIRSSAERSQNSWPLCFSWKGDAVALHQADEVLPVCSATAPSGRSGVVAHEVPLRRARVQVAVGEVGAAAARDADFLGHLVAVVQQQHLQPALASNARRRTARRRRRR